MATLLAFVNLLIIALVWVSLDASYRQYQERAATTSRNLNRLVSQSITGDIERIDLGLRAVVDEIEHLQASGHTVDATTLDEMLTRQHSRLPMADSVRIANAQGETIAGLHGVPGKVLIADRDYFLRLHDDPKAELVVSQLVLGRISGKWVLIFARRLNSPGGGFWGVVYAAITTDWFEQKFSELEVGPNGTVVMRGDASRDFDILARFPRGGGYVGQTKVSPTFRTMITTNPQGGTYEAHAGADNIRRIFSYKPIAGFPMITLVGLATEDYFAEWWRDAIKVLLLAAGFSGVTILGGMRMLRAWRTLELRTEELGRSNSDLEQFAYVASHDLQTPLRNIVSYTQLLERRYKGRLDADADDFITFIVDSSRQMGRLISDLLEYSRVSNQVKMLEPVSASDAVAQALRNIKSDLESAGIEVSVGELPKVLAEPTQLVSLFQNLLGNAAKYRDPDRTLALSVTAEQMTPEWWRFAVADTGIGIDPQYHEKVFVIFQRLEPNKFPGGTGIGLALCRRIIHRFGGTIWIASKPGVGTTFFFTLQDGGNP